MNFLQLHEQLRLELLRRIERGVLTGTLLARQTGLRAPHISNFLHGKRRLSLDALDLVMAAQNISIELLLPPAHERSARAKKAAHPITLKIPLVTQSMAMHEAQIRQSSILEFIHLPSGALDHLRTRRSPERRDWERFVAVRASHAQAEAMVPAIVSHAILVIDRHYNSFTPYHPQRPNIYAVQREASMLFRYASYQGNCIILRPHKIEAPLELIDLRAGDSPSSIIIGRICASISEL